MFPQIIICYTNGSHSPHQMTHFDERIPSTGSTRATQSNYVILIQDTYIRCVPHYGQNTVWELKLANLNDMLRWLGRLEGQKSSKENLICNLKPLLPAPNIKGWYSTKAKIGPLSQCVHNSMQLCICWWNETDSQKIVTALLHFKQKIVCY